MKKKKNILDQPFKVLFIFFSLSSFIVLGLVVGRVHTQKLTENCIVEKGTYLHSTQTYTKRYCIPDGWKRYIDLTKSHDYLVSPEVEKIENKDEVYIAKGALIHVSITKWLPEGLARENFPEYQLNTFDQTVEPRQHKRYQSYVARWCSADNVCSEITWLIEGVNFVEVSYTCAECAEVQAVPESEYYKDYLEFVDGIVF